MFFIFLYASLQHYSILVVCVDENRFQYTAICFKGISKNGGLKLEFAAAMQN